eukprot:6884749-Pyramimonas_sp.AAC.1
MGAWSLAGRPRRFRGEPSITMVVSISREALAAKGAKKRTVQDPVELAAQRRVVDAAAISVSRRRSCFQKAGWYWHRLFACMPMGRVRLRAGCSAILNSPIMKNSMVGVGQRLVVRG